jgi:hypothetical protein
VARPLNAKSGLYFSVLEQGCPVTSPGIGFRLLMKLKLNYDRQSFGQSVLVSGTHLGPATSFYFSLKFSLDSCGFVICSTLSDERTGLQFIVTGGPRQRSPAGPKTVFYFPKPWDSPNLEGQVPVFVSPSNRLVQIYPLAWVFFSAASYDSKGYGGGILSRLHESQSSLYSLGTDCTENTASHSSFIVLWARCLAMVLVLLRACKAAA